MNTYIQKLIIEQFNIGNMNLNNNIPKHNMNIFNKKYNVPYCQRILDGTITKDEIITLNSLVNIVKPKNEKELIKIAKFYSDNYPEDSMNWLDVSEITSMHSLFIGLEHIRNQYNGDISKWDVSNVTNMVYMFANSCFNGDISKWDVSNVTNMRGMFDHSNFNGDISNWNVSNVEDMDNMFRSSMFNQDISGWDVSNVITMEEMFCSSSFDQDISNWNVKNVKYYKNVFYYCPINTIFTRNKMPIKLRDFEFKYNIY